MAIIISDWGQACDCDNRYRVSFIEENPSDHSIFHTLDLIDDPAECQFVLLGETDLIEEVWGEEDIQDTLEMFFKPEDPICANTIYYLNKTGKKTKVPKNKIWK